MTQSDPEATRCKGWTHTDSVVGHRCPRPAKEGYNYCGPHLAGKRRKEANERRQDAEYREHQALMEHRVRQRTHDQQIGAAKNALVDIVRDLRDRGVLSVADLIKYKDMLVESLERMETLEASRP